MELFTNFFTGFWAIVTTVFVWVVEGAASILLALLFMLYDGFLSFIENFINSISWVSHLGDPVFIAAGLPPQLIYCAHAIGIPGALTIFIGALTIRKLLDLIPAAFTRF